jgi:hypothetical protein
VVEFDIARTRKTLFGALLDARDKFGRNKEALEDLERQPITFGRLVLGSLVLGRKLAGLTREREYVGVLLPNVQAIAVTLFGLNAFGRVPAFLNFTAGLKNLKSACDLAGMRTIITSRRFVEQGKLDDVVEALGEGRRILWLEDVRGDLTSIDKLRGLFDSWFARRVHARARLQPDDPAVLLFTSGSEGVPKGVVLSNANLVANAYQVKALAGDVLRDDDVFFDPLPIFHSFGLTALSEPAPLPADPEARGRHARHDHARDGHLPAGLCARRRRERSGERPLCHRRGGAGEGRDPQALGEARHRHPGRLWRHGMLAGHRRQPAGPQQARFRRAAPAGNRMASRTGRGHPRGRAPSCARPERHEGLSRSLRAGPGQPAGRGLARHGRHRDGR